jgi:hypothetical protein
MEFKDLIGLKIAAFRGYTSKHGYSSSKTTPLQYILFDDNKTILELSEQDYYSYHDCSPSARHLDLRQDKNLWQRMFDKLDNFNEPDDLGIYPF